MALKIVILRNLAIPSRPVALIRISRTQCRKSMEFHWLIVVKSIRQWIFCTWLWTTIRRQSLIVVVIQMLKHRFHTCSDRFVRVKAPRRGMRVGWNSRGRERGREREMEWKAYSWKIVNYMLDSRLLHDWFSLCPVSVSHASSHFDDINVESRSMKWGYYFRHMRVLFHLKESNPTVSNIECETREKYTFSIS